MTKNQTIGHRIRIAAGLFAAALTSLLPASPALADDSHEVVRGDTVGRLAATYGVAIDSIIAANGLGPRATIYVGQTLTIPSATPAPADTPASATHVVSPGETLSAIAITYSSSVSAIAGANGLASAHRIRVGQTLTIPGASAPADAVVAEVPAASATYTVVAGDSLARIAKRNGTTVDAIVAANSLKNPSLIRVGQLLLLPSGTGLVGNTFANRTYSDAVVAAANDNLAALRAMTLPTKAEMQALIIASAHAQGVDPALAQAISYQESGFKMGVVSPANAVGAMQVIPATGEWAEQLLGRDLNLLNPQDNVDAGVAVLKRLARDGEPVETVIAGYYQGETSVRKYGMFEDTKTYVASVVSLMERFG